jgi:hypothetical protein
MVAAFVFAAFFYAAAEYERLTGWKWALASVVISLVVLQLFEFLAFVIPFQIALFGVMWWRNIKHRDEMEQERTARAEEDRRRRQEQVRRARDQADRGDRK